MTFMDWLMNGFWATVAFGIFACIALGIKFLDVWLACLVGMPWATSC